MSASTISNPSLRFRGFNDLWQTKKISATGNVVTGGTPRTSDRSLYGGDFMFVSPADIGEARYVKSTTKTLTEAGHETGRKVPANSILFVCIGSTIGKVAQAGADCTTNQQINSVIPNSSHDANFLLSLLVKQSSRIRLLAGNQAVPILNKSEFSKISITLPTLPEQKKIADFLTSVDERIGQLIKKKALLEDYKKGVMQQLFSQKIRFKDDNGNDFPDWEEKKLGEVAEVVGGGTPDSTNEDYWNGDVQWFTPTEIRSKFVSQSKRTISESGLKKCSASILPVGTLLLTSRATIAEVSIAREPCTTNQGFQSITVNCNTSNEFIYYWLIQSKKDFLRKAQGSTFLEIGGKEVRKMMLLIPALEEQKKIADFLSAIDQKIESVSQQIAKTQTFKKGLLQQMFV